METSGGLLSPAGTPRAPSVPQRVHQSLTAPSTPLLPQVSRGVRSQSCLREGRCGEQVVGFRETWVLGYLSVPRGGGQQLWAQRGAPGGLLHGHKITLIHFLRT